MADEITTPEPNSTETATTETSTAAATTETTEGIDLGASETPETTDGETDKVEQTDEEKAAEAEKAELFGAPAEGEDYTIDGLPEGMDIDKDALAAVTPAFRKLGLSNKGASEVARVYATDVLPKVIDKYNEGMTQQILDTRKAWEGESIDAISGKTALKTSTGDMLAFDGKSAKQVQADAARALDRIAPAGFREFLAETGLGQHPGMVAFAYQAGKLLAEDTDFEGGSATKGEKTREEKYYGSE